MHLLILNGAARPQGRSNTARIVSAFQSGFVEGGNTAQVFHLSDRSQWADVAAAFGRCENVLIALPLYVENIPDNQIRGKSRLLRALKEQKDSGQLPDIHPSSKTKQAADAQTSQQ